MTTGGRVLVVDDEQGVRSTLSAVLRDEGYDVETAESGEECLAILDERSFRAILLDVWLPGRDGLETLKTLRRNGVDAAVIMISGHGSIETAVKATKLGAHDFVEKPLSLEKIVLTLQNALRVKKLEERNRILRDQLRRETELIGDSAPIAALRATIEAAAPTSAGVLIAGESGSGKELAARLIHARSPRADEAFVEIACSGAASERIEEELFGRASGLQAEALKGKLELASEGTLYLEEIWALPEPVQQRLQRALETGRYLPVDGHVAIAANVRPIASTERDLAAEVAAGRFREDLYLALNVVPMIVPSLRERREDIPHLVEHFLARYAKEYGRSVKGVEPVAMEALVHYGWPGNVRELVNVVERIVILCPNESITLSDLPKALTEGPPAPADPDTGEVPRMKSLPDARAEFERAFILERLGQVGWNIARAAESLGVERSNLYRKMRSYGIRPSPPSP